MGDIHGNFKALKQCLEKSEFDYEKDTLIQLGDVVDGFPQTFECVEELLKIKNLIAIKGNHDDIFLQWLHMGIHNFDWLQGSVYTAESYANHTDRDIIIRPRDGGYHVSLANIDIPESHIKFFNSQHYYYADVERNSIFVHAGFNPKDFVKDQKHIVLLWDRTLWNKAMSAGNQKLNFVENWNKVYLGHTATTNWVETIPGIGDVEITKPLYRGGVWNLDTGAGWGGKLTIMDIDTEEYWQSDLTNVLYPGFAPR